MIPPGNQTVTKRRLISSPARVAAIVTVLLAVLAPTASARLILAVGEGTACVDPWPETQNDGLRWDVGGLPDPFQPSAFYWAYWTITEHYSTLTNGACVLTSRVCDVLVFDEIIVGAPLSFIKTKWILNEATTLEGRYQAIPFEGSDAPAVDGGPDDRIECSPEYLHVEGQVLYTPLSVDQVNPMVEVFPIVAATCGAGVDWASC